jgi:hypothetical protein
LGFWFTNCNGSPILAVWRLRFRSTVSIFWHDGWWTRCLWMRRYTLLSRVRFISIYGYRCNYCI